MNITVGSYRLAKKFRPEGRAYAIRILGTGAKAEAIASETLEGEYVFVDILRFDETSRINEDIQYPTFENERVEKVLKRIFRTGEEDDERHYGEGLARRMLGRVFRKRKRTMKLFDREIAERALNNFLKFGNDCDEILVHCIAGQERSPAVAIGLRDRLRLDGKVFRLHAEGDSLVRVVCSSNPILEFPWYDAQVYSTLMSNLPAKESDLSLLSLRS